MRISSVALSCSLIAGFAARSAALDYGRLYERLSQRSAAIPVAKQIAADSTADRSLSNAARLVLQASGPTRKDAIERLVGLMETRATAQGAADLTDRDRLRRWAEDATKSPLYTDPGAKQSSNWIGKSLEKLSKIDIPTPRVTGRLPGAPVFLPSFLIGVVWAILAGALLFLVYLALRHFSWKRSLQRRARAMLEADEPERTLDEWLAMAEKLTSEGKFREAVRCLYLACLLRFDEHMIARFDRAQTNWEHLARIRASSKLPLGLDFEPPTKRFDTVWYGQRTRGMSDVELFREWYVRVTKTLSEVKP